MDSVKGETVDEHKEIVGVGRHRHYLDKVIDLQKEMYVESAKSHTLHMCKLLDVIILPVKWI